MLNSYHLFQTFANLCKKIIQNLVDIEGMIILHPEPNKNKKKEVKREVIKGSKRGR